MKDVSYQMGVANYSEENADIHFIVTACHPSLLDSTIGNSDLPLYLTVFPGD